MNKYVIYIIALLSGFCSNNIFNDLYKKLEKKEIILLEGVRIILTIEEKSFNTLNTFSQIEIWIDSQIVFKDESTTEYIFGNNSWPQARKIENGIYEVVIEVFDAPDLNKLRAFYFRDNVLINSKVLPFFESQPEDINYDGIKEYFGVMHISDAHENPDSCYYNPVLYYKVSNNGIDLDSSLTIMMNKKIWGEFYGFEQNEIIVPCAR
ncbi:MAG: hypothetical protein CVT92_16995 [Bacteroidetes bacterium HGW-Bacteroidetes-1]|jgi:hypothetical protein|nr:MAG: hypothetical protein CVT92_16995 [Bacteroidetes bacterium HGW-Bacteroidetes-1]